MCIIYRFKKNLQCKLNFQIRIINNNYLINLPQKYVVTLGYINRIIYFYQYIFNTNTYIYSILLNSQTINHISILVLTSSESLIYLFI